MHQGKSFSQVHVEASAPQWCGISVKPQSCALAGCGSGPNNAREHLRLGFEAAKRARMDNAVRSRWKVVAVGCAGSGKRRPRESSTCTAYDQHEEV